MNTVLRHSSAWVLAVGLGGCTAPEPPLLAAAPVTASTIAPAQGRASNDDAGPTAAARVTPALAASDGPQPAALVSVALDHAGDVLIGQRFSELAAESAWHPAGIGGATGGHCEFYERGSLPEGVSMMVEDDHVQRFELAPIDGSGLVVLQPGPFGLSLGMPLADVLQRLPRGSVQRPLPAADADADADESFSGQVSWQDPGSDLAIRVDIIEGVATTLYWGAGGAVELTEGCAAHVR